MLTSSDKVTKVLFAVIIVMTIAVIFNSFYKFYFQKDYEFIVEAPCDPTEQICFIRSCDDEECPPNQLEHYRIFALNAADFEQCSNDSCLSECTVGVIECEEILCGESSDDICIDLPVAIEEESKEELNNGFEIQE
jgi:hypothetical protein